MRTVQTTKVWLRGIKQKKKKKISNFVSTRHAPTHHSLQVSPTPKLSHKGRQFAHTHTQASQFSVLLTLCYFGYLHILLIRVSAPSQLHPPKFHLWRKPEEHRMLVPGTPITVSISPSLTHSNSLLSICLVAEKSQENETPLIDAFGLSEYKYS